MCTPGTRPSGGVCSGGIICKSFGIQRRNYYRLIAAPVCIHAYTHPNATLHFHRVNKAVASPKGWKWRAGGVGKNKLFPVWPAINPASVVIKRDLRVEDYQWRLPQQIVYDNTYDSRGLPEAGVFSRGIYIMHIRIKIYTCTHTEMDAVGTYDDDEFNMAPHRDGCRGGRCGPA